MQEPTDRQLILEMQVGDRAAMEEFFRRYSPYLYAVCLRYLSDRETAKDLLHDAFLKILTTVQTFKISHEKDDVTIRRSIKSWTARLTANLALNHLRDSAHMLTVSIDNAQIDDIPDKEINADALSADTLMRLIEDLPTNYRTVFNLFAVEGFTHREISQMLGISESLSATQYHRAKNLLKNKISKLQNKQ